MDILITSTDIPVLALVEPTSLPDLGRRLYGWNGGGRGVDRARRRAGAVVRERRKKAAARVRRPTPLGSRQ